MNETLNQSENSEPEQTKTGWDDITEMKPSAHKTIEHGYGFELTNVHEINIDSQEGRFDYLTSLVENAQIVKSERLRILEDGFYDHIREAEPSFSGFSDGEISSLEDDTRRSLELANTQKNILENLDFSKSSVIQALRAKSEEYQKKMSADGMSEDAARKFLLLHEAADNLYMIMVDEIKQRKQEKGLSAQDAQEPNASPTTPREVVRELSALYDNGALQEEAKVANPESSAFDQWAAKHQREVYKRRKSIIIDAENSLDGNNTLESILDAQIRSKQSVLDRQQNKETPFAVQLRLEVEDLTAVKEEVSAIRQYYEDNPAAIPWAS